MVFLYAHNKQFKNETKEKIPLMIAPKIIKYLRVNLTEDV